MTDNETKMITLLRNATKAMSKRFPDMKKSQQEINEFLSTCFIPKKEITELQTILIYNSLEESEKAYETFSKRIKINLLENNSDEYVDLKDLIRAHRILTRRRENLRKSVPELFDEMENAYHVVVKEKIPTQLVDDLAKFKEIMSTKDIVNTITEGKALLNMITSQKDYHIDWITILKINSIKFFVRMLEEKSLGYVIKKES